MTIFQNQEVTVTLHTLPTPLMFEIHEVYIRQHKFGNALLKNKKKTLCH